MLCPRSSRYQLLNPVIGITVGSETPHGLELEEAVLLWCDMVSSLLHNHRY
jgi:hypothetical protein